MNVSKMSREKIAAALAKGGRYMNHARQWVAVKVGERVNPDDIALALVSPDALIVREAVRMASKAGRGAKKAAGAVARKVRKNPTGTGAAAVGERGGWSIVKPEKRDDAGGVLAWGPSGMLEDSEGRPYPFRWALVPLSRIIPSNDPKTGRPLRFYLPELQGRNREAVASRSQVHRSWPPASMLAGSCSPARRRPTRRRWCGEGPGSVPRPSRGVRERPDHGRDSRVRDGIGGVGTVPFPPSLPAGTWPRSWTNWTGTSGSSPCGCWEGKDGAPVEQAVALAGADRAPPRPACPIWKRPSTLAARWGSRRRSPWAASSSRDP